MVFVSAVFLFGSVSYVCICQIQRIENPNLYVLYAMERAYANAANGPLVDSEKLLWHDTTAEAAEIICCRGFNRSFNRSKIFFSNMS